MPSTGDVHEFGRFKVELARLPDVEPISLYFVEDGFGYDAHADIVAPATCNIMIIACSGTIPA